MKRFLRFLKSLFKKNAPPSDEKTDPKIELPVGVKIQFDLQLLEMNLQKFLGSLYQPKQFDGYARIIREFQSTFVTDIRWLAYILATALHETAHTMKPVTEYGSQHYLRSKKYWPYIGRGYVQLTWDYNYKKYGIEKTPEKALDPDFSAYVIVDGMMKGIFTGKKLSDYFNDRKNDPYNARRIVNGIDRANPIAGYHEKILKALEASKITVEQHLPLT